MTQPTVLLVGDSLYIGIDMRTHNVNHFYDMIINELEKYDRVHQVSYLFSYLNDDMITVKADILPYHDISKDQYNDILDDIIVNIDCDELYYLLLQFKVSARDDIEWYVFEPEGDISEYFKIVVGNDLLYYIDYKSYEDGFDNMDVSYIKFDRDTILHEKITYNSDYSTEEYFYMVENGYHEFLRKYNMKPELMVIRLTP